MRPSTLGLRSYVAAIALIFLAACSGGRSATSLTPAVAPSAAPAAAARAPMQVKMHVPARATAQASRNPATISPSAAGLAITVASVLAPSGSGTTTVYDISTDAGSVCTSNGDGSRDCTVTVSAPVGNDAFTVVVYDRTPSGTTIPVTANVLGQTTTQATIVANTTQTLTFTLGGQVASLQVTPSTVVFTSGVASSTTVYVTALDADNNIITGTAKEPYTNPITVGANGSMFSVQLAGGSAAPSVTLNSPAQSTVTVNYSGAALTTTYQVQASATGTTGAVASIINSTGSGSGSVTVPGTSSGRLIALDSFGTAGADLVGIPANAATSAVTMTTQPVNVPAIGSIAMDSSGTGTIYAIVTGTPAIDVFHIDASNPALATLSGVITGTATHLTSPVALAVGPGGVLYVADAGNAHGVSGGSILAFSPATLGGSPAPSLEFYGSSHGLSANGPTSISVDATGNIFAFVPGTGVIEYPQGGGATTTFATDQAGKTNVGIVVDQSDAALLLVDGQEYPSLSGYCSGGYDCALVYAYQIGDQSAAAQYSYQYNIAYGASRGIAESASNYYLETTYNSTEALIAAMPTAIFNSFSSGPYTATFKATTSGVNPPYNGITADREASGARAGQVYYSAGGGGLFTPYGGGGLYGNQILQTTGTGATAVTFDSSGTSYVANATANSVTTYASFPYNGYQYAAQTLSGNNTGLCSPSSIATDSYRNLYVLNTCGNGTVTVYKPLGQSSGNVAPILTINLPSGSSPYQIAVDSGNRLYVSDNAQGHSDIYIYNASSTTVAATFSMAGYGYPSGVAVAPNGTLYVYCQALGTAGILGFKPSGTSFSTSPATIVAGANAGLSAPAAPLAIDANDLYVPSGTGILVFNNQANGNVTPATIAQSGVEFGSIVGVAVAP